MVSRPASPWGDEKADGSLLPTAQTHEKGGLLRSAQGEGSQRKRSLRHNWVPQVFHLPAQPPGSPGGHSGDQGRMPMGE